MKRILLSVSMLTLVGSIAAIGSTGAFFSDTETSSGNTFTAGAIDLKIDNHSFYNGNECKDVGTPQAPNYQWVGTAPFPVAGTPCTTTWTADDLTNNLGVTIHKFFDFADLKPGDYSEDTISLYAQNDAYLCANVKLTSNDENGCNTPESAVDQTCGNPGPNQGELAQNINFIWWADLNGNNVLEQGETVLPGGALGALGVGGSFNLTLADSLKNIWNPAQAGGPLPGNTTKYIGKAWCFGTITATPVAQGQGDPVTNPGYTCNGTGLGNETQSDSATADVTFSAVQARNNPGFVCNGNCTFDPGANLVTNGSFETPVVNTPDKWNIYSGSIPGWTAEWVDPSAATGKPATANIELHNGVLGLASDGNQYTELDSDWDGPGGSINNEPASVTIHQSIPTQAGAHYNLHFAFAPRPNTAAATNDLEVKWDGAVVYDTGQVAGGGGPIVWTGHDIDVVGTGSPIELRFTDRGVADSYGTFLDDVKVTQTSCVNAI